MIQISQAVSNFLFRVGTGVANYAKDNAPVITSNLKNDIQVFDGDIESGVIEIGNSTLAYYAKWVHEGTDPYTIRAVNARALRTPYGFFRRVEHPGISANPYIENGLRDYIDLALERDMDEAGEDIEQSILQEIDNAVRGGLIQTS